MCYTKTKNCGGDIMKFHTVQSFNDDYFNKALDFYNRQLDIDFYEDSSIIKKIFAKQ